MTQVLVHVSRIEDNPYQQRAEYGNIVELAERIEHARGSFGETRGLMQVPSARLVLNGATLNPDVYAGALQEDLAQPFNGQPDDLRLELAFGHRRLRAFRHLVQFQVKGYADGLMPLNVQPLSDEQMLDAVWAENRERRDLAEVEEAAVMQAALEMLGCSQSALAQRWGVSRPVIGNRLRLLQLTPQLQELNRKGQLSERQCLALLPVLDLAEKVNGNLEWSPDPVFDYFSPPPAPDVYLGYIAQNPEVPSDDIRKQVEKMMKHAGEALPDGYAGMTLYGPGIVQEKCAGCAHRVRDFCLQTACLKKKKTVHEQEVLDEASQAYGLKISRVKAHFDLEYSSHRALKKLGQAGTWLPRMVIGLVGGNYAYRPETNEIEYVRDDEPPQERLAVGWDGDEAELLGAVGEKVADAEEEKGPLQKEWDIWHQADKAQKKRWNKLVRDVLIEELEWTVPDWEPLASLFQAGYPKETKLQGGTNDVVRWVVEQSVGASAMEREYYAYKSLADARRILALFRRPAETLWRELTDRQCLDEALARIGWPWLRERGWPRSSVEKAGELLPLAVEAQELAERTGYLEAQELLELLIDEMEAALEGGEEE